MAFSIWVDHPELKWAKQSWNLIVRAGLANFSNEIERCRAALRFLAMCGLYHDFCEVAWEETSYPEYAEWAEKLEIGIFRVDQLIGPDSAWLNSDDEKEELFSEGVKSLADEARQKVFNVLCKGYGNKSRLFLSLWKSKQSTPDPLALIGTDKVELEDLFETDTTKPTKHCAVRGNNIASWHEDMPGS